MTDPRKVLSEMDVADRQQREADAPDPPVEVPPWPELDAAAYHGLAGELVATVEPHTEADPVAVLAQFLVGFGSCCNRGPHFPVGADQHHANLNMLLIGDGPRLAELERSFAARGCRVEVFDTRLERSELVSRLGELLESTSASDVCVVCPCDPSPGPEHGRQLRA